MDHPPGRPRGAGAVQPEATVITGSVRRRQLWRGRARDLREAKLARTRLPYDDQVPRIAALAPGHPEGVRDRFAHDGDLRPTVVQEVRILLGSQVGVDRDRHGTQLDRAEEGCRELRRVL